MTAVFSGLEQGIQPLFSQYYACNEHYNIIKVLKYAFITVILSSIAIYSTIFIFSENIVQLFNSQNNLQMQLHSSIWNEIIFYCNAICRNKYCILYLFYFYRKGSACTYFVIAERTDTYYSYGFLLSTLWDITGVWLCYAVTECIVTIIAIMFYFHIKNIKKQNSKRMLRVAKQTFRKFIKRVVLKMII